MWQASRLDSSRHPPPFLGVFGDGVNPSSSVPRPISSSKSYVEGFSGGLWCCCSTSLPVATVRRRQWSTHGRQTTISSNTNLPLWRPEGIHVVLYDLASCTRLPLAKLCVREHVLQWHDSLDAMHPNLDATTFFKNSRFTWYKNILGLDVFYNHLGKKQVSKKFRGHVPFGL